MKINKKTLFRISMTGLLSLFVVFFIQVASCYDKDGSSLFGSSVKSPLRGSGEVSDAVNVQNTFRKIFNINKERVVFISTEQTVKLPEHPFFRDPFFRDFFGREGSPKLRPQKRTGLGTGFILSDDGYIGTNHHVVAGVDKVKVKINGISYDAKIIGSDKRTDIALLKIEPEKKLKPVYIGDSDKVRVGDWAIAIGNPFGLDRTFTVGVVSATGRMDLGLMGGTQTHIQTDASINPGNSGGPLINVYGEVVGINRMIYSRSGGSMGIGFAIPINSAKVILDQLKKYKKIKRGFIGVQIVNLTEEYAKELGLDKNEGALIGAVVEGGPSEKSGLKVGDVILKVNDKIIKNFTDLVSEVEKTPIGKTIKVVTWRKKKKINHFITVGERPKD